MTTAEHAAFAAFVRAWDVCDARRGRYSCSPAHDCRCPGDRGTGECTCGGDALEAARDAIRLAPGGEAASTPGPDPWELVRSLSLALGHAGLDDKAYEGVRYPLADARAALAEHDAHLESQEPTP